MRLAAEVGVSDFETRVRGSILTEALRFRQEDLSELKCYSAPMKSNGKMRKSNGKTNAHFNSKYDVTEPKARQTDRQMVTL